MSVNKHNIIRELSDRLVKAQKPIRILNDVKWDHSIKHAFFHSKFKKLPEVNRDYYLKQALPYNPEEKSEEFYLIERDIRKELGQFSNVGGLMRRMCREYRGVIRMIQARGTPQFSIISQELFGSSEDAFYAGAPTLNDLALLISETVRAIDVRHKEKIAEEKIYSAEDAVALLNERLRNYFGDEGHVARVTLSDDIFADAAAGAEAIRIRSGATFSERQLRVLEVHEGWVHLGTTLNGIVQPTCTFLSKGTPSSTITQEGLAIITEIFTFSSYPGRVQRLTDRITVIHMAEQGANFIDVFNYYREQGENEEEAYARTVRVFRGSVPDGGPLTKDLAYSKGFVLIYNFIRLAIQKGLESYIPLLFVGKTTLEDIHVISDLVKEGIVIPPTYIPPQFKDMAALSSWMSYSLFLNQLSLQQMAHDYKTILTG